MGAKEDAEKLKDTAEAAQEALEKGMGALLKATDVLTKSIKELAELQTELAMGPFDMKSLSALGVPQLINKAYISVDKTLPAAIKKVASARSDYSAAIDTVSSLGERYGKLLDQYKKAADKPK